ncbi:IS110 family transposase [Gordonia alkaliphila]|uniref:IS110 family transposase n=1 Tax=Gordonia alkaliphila TaxID=1053547 RepID=A0ABP8ZIB6_9ACTN
MLFIGDDWAEGHHDIEVMDGDRRTMARTRLPEGVAGITRFHDIVSQFLEVDADPATVLIGIETDRGPWVAALVAAGYRVHAVNPLQAARYRDLRGVSGAKSDAGDAHVLADMVRVDGHQLRAVAGDSADAEALKVVSRAHKTLIWERNRHSNRLRHVLRDYFPAALEAFEDITAPDALALLAKAPDPDAAARLTVPQIRAALKAAHRRGIEGKISRIRAALRTDQLRQPPALTAGCAVVVRSIVAVLQTLNTQIASLQTDVEVAFAAHPDAEIIGSQPGIGQVLGARVLGEFGDDPTRYRSAKARRNFAGTSPITRASGKKRVVAARHVHNDRLVDAVLQQAFTAIRTSPGARAYYEHERARGVEPYAALRHVGNRLVGILHGCLRTRSTYCETMAWPNQPAHVTKTA